MPLRKAYPPRAIAGVHGPVRPDWMKLLAGACTGQAYGADHLVISAAKETLGTKRGANEHRHRATSGHVQRFSLRLEPMSGDTGRRPATLGRCLLSSRSRVRVALGAPSFVATRPGTGKGSRLPQEPSSLSSVAQPLNPDNKHKLIRGVYKECNETLVMPAEMQGA
jgi:hypothetical protein